MGEPPPSWAVERCRDHGVRLDHVRATDAAEALAEHNPHGYVMNSFSHEESPRLTSDLLALAPALTVVTYQGQSRELGDYASYVDAEALRCKGIAFTHAPAGDVVAEATIGLLHILELDLATQPKTRVGLQGSTLGIVGMGQIGRRVAQVATAHGMRIVYHSRSRQPDLDAPWLSLTEVVAIADHVTLHLPNSAPAGIVDAAVLSGADGCTLVNTTSAPKLIDPVALIDALRAGRVRAAAIEGRYPAPYQDQLRGAGRAATAGVRLLGHARCAPRGLGEGRRDSRGGGQRCADPLPTALSRGFLVRSAYPLGNDHAHSAP